MLILKIIKCLVDCHHLKSLLIIVFIYTVYTETFVLNSMSKTTYIKTIHYIKLVSNLQ